MKDPAAWVRMKIGVSTLLFLDPLDAHNSNDHKVLITHMKSVPSVDTTALGQLSFFLVVFPDLVQLLFIFRRTIIWIFTAFHLVSPVERVSEEVWAAELSVW